jgi:hypothetical protein
MLVFLRNIWTAIPAPIRTVINVAVAAAALVVVSAVIKAQGVTGVDWSATGISAIDALGLGLATAVLRWINPLDDGYGRGSAARGIPTATDNGSRPGDGEQPSQEPDAFPIPEDDR